MGLGMEQCRAYFIAIVFFVTGDVSTHEPVAYPVYGTKVHGIVWIVL